MDDDTFDAACAQQQQEEQAQLEAAPKAIRITYEPVFTTAEIVKLQTLCDEAVIRLSQEMRAWPSLVTLNSAEIQRLSALRAQLVAAPVRFAV
jgi:hypothetical protein